MASQLVAHYNTNIKNIRGLNLCGILCLPCCCAGCSFFILKKIPQEFNDKINKVINLYGGNEACNFLREKINIELQIFRNAVTKINNTINPEYIIADINILEMILYSNTKIKNIFKGINTSFDLNYTSKYTLSLLRNNIDNTKTYILAIWNEYLNNNGNYHVIIYGVLEYFASLYSEVSDPLMDSMNALLDDTSFRTEILSHKDFI